MSGRWRALGSYLPPPLQSCTDPRSPTSASLTSWEEYSQVHHSFILGGTCILPPAFTHSALGGPDSAGSHCCMPAWDSLSCLLLPGDSFTIPGWGWVLPCCTLPFSLPLLSATSLPPACCTSAASGCHSPATHLISCHFTCLSLESPASHILIPDFYVLLGLHSTAPATLFLEFCPYPSWSTRLLPFLPPASLPAFSAGTVLYRFSPLQVSPGPAWVPHTVLPAATVLYAWVCIFSAWDTCTVHFSRSASLSFLLLPIFSGLSFSPAWNFRCLPHLPHFSASDPRFHSAPASLWDPA